VYLTFERFGKALDPSQSRIAETQVATSESKKKGNDVWLRLHNNTRWSIAFRTWSYYFGKITKPYRPGEGSSFRLTDGMEVNTIYAVIESDGRRVPASSDTYNVSWLPPGRSVIFSVRREDLLHDRFIYVGFNYEWEMKDKSPGNGEPSHRVEFHPYYQLPGGKI
jgi:hypothetical protein